MLPATLRMRRSEDFQMTIRHGVRARSGSLVMHCRAVSGRQDAHVGFVVSAAVGGAVARNAVRRRLRGVVLQERSTLPSGTDLVVRVLPSAATSEFDGLAADFSAALSVVSARMGGVAS